MKYKDREFEQQGLASSLIIFNDSEAINQDSVPSSLIVPG